MCVCFVCVVVELVCNVWINRRLEAVNVFYEDPVNTEGVVNLLKECRDLERSMQKVLLFVVDLVPPAVSMFSAWQIFLDCPSVCLYSK